MKKIIILSAIVLLIAFLKSNSQASNESTNNKLDISVDSSFVRGQILDQDKQIALHYANIYVLQKHIGAISNETGHFSISASGLEKTDTLRIQYIGYITKNIAITDLDSSSIIFMKEEIFNLNETLIFGSAPSAVSIVKKVLINKDSNYKANYSKRQVFIRERDDTDVEDIQLKYKKSSISEIDRDLIKETEEKIPKHATSYTDFLGYIYTSGLEDDSIKLKTDPIRAVSLKEKDIAEAERLFETFETVFTNIDSNEYWKVKSGIFSDKIDTDDMDTDESEDTIVDSGRKLKSFSRSNYYRLKFTSLDDDKQWEFLHKTGKYRYTLIGGTRVGGEDVYIIDFVPKNSGLYEGRMYVSTETYALIRADYEFALNKTGRDIQLLGIGYTENQFSGSIYFEKKNDNYVLKYFSKQEGAIASIDRNFALIKKRERTFFDKKLNEIKLGLELTVNNQESLEFLVLDEEEISSEVFNNFNQQESMEIIYVDQFDENLWKGFSIIEPTQQMKDYKKAKSESY